jgi:hypothetical protein
MDMVGGVHFALLMYASKTRLQPSHVFDEIVVNNMGKMNIALALNSTQL